MKKFPGLPVIIALTGFLTVAVSPAHAHDPQTLYLEVTGSGQASGPPDTALLSLTVLRAGDTARQALDDNNNAMARVLSEMRSLGIKAADLRTSGFSIQPRYARPGPGKGGQRPAPVLVGYTVTSQLSVKVREILRTGEVLDRAVSTGVNQVGHIRLTVDDPRELRQQARADAMKDALSRAQTLAGTGGVTLGQIQIVREQNAAPAGAPMMEMRMAMSADAASVPLATGEITFRANVAVRWALGH